jgi:hypothetical protein
VAKKADADEGRRKTQAVVDFEVATYMQGGKIVVRNRSMYFLIQNHDDGDKKYTADEFYRRTLKHDWRNKKLLQSSSTSESPPSVVPLLRINIQNEQ